MVFTVFSLQYTSFDRIDEKREKKKKKKKRKKWKISSSYFHELNERKVKINKS